MGQKSTSAILFGGKSAEHEISLISAMNIIRALDRERFEPLLIGVDRDGAWYLQDEGAYMAKDADPKTIALTDRSRPLAVLPGEQETQLLDLSTGERLRVDVAFPILHGPYGEDGSMQGLLKQLDIPFVGPDVMGSAVAMDKEICKRVLNDAGIPNAPFRSYHREERAQIDYAALATELGIPMFVKPANMGSSVGVSKVENAEEFEKALDSAFSYDRKIVIEQGIRGREIECAVLGNEDAKGSVPGEVIPISGFYSYDAKYIDDKGAVLDLPAKNLSEAEVKRIQELAVRTFHVLGCEGLSRVDFFLAEDGELFVNEVNTLPGFTKISMYPSLWGLSGVAYTDLISRLLDLASARHAREAAIRTDMDR